MFSPVMDKTQEVVSESEEELESMRVEWRRLKEEITTCMDDLVFELDSDLRALEHDYYIAGGKYSDLVKG